LWGADFPRLAKPRLGLNSVAASRLVDCGGQISQGSQSFALGLALSPLRGWLIVGQISQGSQSLALGLALSPLRGWLIGTDFQSQARRRGGLE